MAVGTSVASAGGNGFSGSAGISAPLVAAFAIPSMGSAAPMPIPGALRRLLWAVLCPLSSALAGVRSWLVGRPTALPGLTVRLVVMEQE